MKWSNSALTTLQQCGEKYRRRYVEKEFHPSGLAAKRGTAVHKVVSSSHARQLGKKLAEPSRYHDDPADRKILLAEALPSLEEAKSIAADAFEVAKQEGYVLSDDEKREGEGKVIAHMKDAAVTLAGLYVGKVAASVDPIAVERKIEVRPKDSDLVINGKLDLVSTFDDGEEIRDQKTGEKSPFSEAADKSQQLSMYALLRWAEKGTAPKRVVLDHLVRTPAGQKVYHVEQVSSRGPEAIGALVQRINVAVTAVERGVFMPTNPDNWWCSKAYCEFFATCPYVQGRPRPKS